MPQVHSFPPVADATATILILGSMAEKCFHKHVRPLLEAQPLHYQRLPSTSPANASMTYEQKLKAWKMILQCSPARQPDGPAKNGFSQPAHVGH